MCKFDKDPLWNLYGRKQIEDGECIGQFHDWYYNLLLAAHTYFVIEFLLRVTI